MGAGVMNSYEFAHFGRDLRTLEQTIAAWCSGNDCLLEAMRMVRVWMRRSS
jgi:hypothetical protein